MNDVITTEKDINTPLIVTVEGVPKFHCRAGLFKAQKAFRVETALAPTAAAPKKPAA